VLLEGSYNVGLVFLSVLIAIYSSYVSLNFISRLRNSDSAHIIKSGIITSGLVLGLGVWSMHFVGMMAFSLPIPVFYDGTLTLLSLVVAIIAAIIGLAIANSEENKIRLLSGGLILGIGISSMHYIGMFAMRMAAYMHHNLPLIILSVIIGITASIIALWIVFAVNKDEISTSFQFKSISAVIMGSAIAGMHYTGMFAMSFHATNDPNYISSGFELDPGIIGVALTVSVLLLMTFALWFSRIVAESNLIQENEEKIRAITENLLDIIITINTSGIIEFTNAAITRTFGYQPEEVIGKNVNILMPYPWKDNHDAYIHNYLTTNHANIMGQAAREYKGVKKNGELFPIDLSLSETVIAGQKYFIGTIRDISERNEAQQQLLYLAHHDILTTLPNRHSFIEHLERSLSQAKRRDKMIAVMFLDLDRFKVINDTLGHNIGDLLLKEIAKRLKYCVRDSDVIARLSGDEFTILLDDITTANDISPIAEKIIKEIALPFMNSGHELFTSASIGISIFPDDGKTASSIMRHADIAMYRAKSKGGNQFCFYSTGMNARTSNRLKLESDLRRALERDEFELYYQPQIDTENGVYSGVEALLRWNHPELGLLPPVDFVPQLEETGHIIPVSEWIILTACQQAMSWEKAGIPPIHIAVNLSARQFSDKDMVEKIAHILEKTGVNPEHLELEITENILMQPDSHTMNSIRNLHALGIQLAIDDFGTGYSSLSYLKRFPIHTLKIDRSFVRDIAIDSDDASIVQLIIDMAHSLKLNVVAEGVETKEQIEFLKQRKCWEMQGYYFSKPLPADEIIHLLRSDISPQSRA